MARARVRAAVLVALVAAGLGARGAAAHGDDPLPSAVDEHELRAAETVALGPAHAREHAIERAAERRRAARLAAMTPEARRRWASRERASDRRRLAAANAAVAGEPKNEVGEWSGRFGLPDYVMNAALLHTGEVAMWGWLPYNEQPDPDGVTRRPLRGENWFWDTSKPLPGLLDDDTAGAFREQDAPKIQIGGATQTPPLYCSGVSFLPDGRLVVAGGSLAFTEDDPANGKGWKGLDTLFIYDPATRQWSKGPTMQHGRWYPTQVMLSDGRTWIGGGYDEGGHEAYVEHAEILNAAANALATVQGPPAGMDDLWGDVGWPGLYPHAWVMPGGQLLIVPREWSRASALMDPGTLTYTPDTLDPWTQRPENEGSTAVLLPNGAEPSNSIMQLGGFAYLKADGVTPDGIARRDTRILDRRELTSASPWKAGPPLNVGRSYFNTVLLPGGGMMTVGGGAGNDPNADPDTTSGLYWDGGGKQDLLNVELFDPASDTWRLGAAQQSFRAYHSVALLLPDGRIWSAGDDWHEDLVSDESGSAWRGNAEIYSPPYLFGGVDPATGAFDPNRPATRTEIADAPARLRWGEHAAVTTSSDDVSKMVLMAPSAVTHSIDTNERQVELEITGRTEGQGVTVRLPGDATTAPPGWYMLFAVNRCGTPSHAAWVRVGEPLAGDPPAGPPTVPPGPRPGPATCGPAPQQTPTNPPAAAGGQDVGQAVAHTAKRAKLARGLTLRPLSLSRRLLRTRGRVEVTARMWTRGRVRVQALFARRGRRAIAVGHASLHFRRAGQKRVAIKLSHAGLAMLRRPGRITLSVKATATGPDGKVSRAVETRRL
jgi:Domain of unknown function (DUF1929)/Kelch motif